MTDPLPLAARIPDLSNCRVLCVGDLMLDRFVYGEVSRISPEAPIPVVRISRETAVLGGAGNVVRNATALGATVCFVAVVGDDAIGRELTAMVGAEERVEPYLLVERKRASTVKTRYIADGQQLLRADSETTQPIAKKTSAITAANRIEWVNPAPGQPRWNCAGSAAPRRITPKSIPYTNHFVAASGA